MNKEKARQLYEADVLADKPGVQRFISRIPTNYRGTASRIVAVDYERLPARTRRAYERKAASVGR